MSYLLAAFAVALTLTAFTPHDAPEHPRGPALHADR